MGYLSNFKSAKFLLCFYAFSCACMRPENHSQLTICLILTTNAKSIFAWNTLNCAIADSTTYLFEMAVLAVVLLQFGLWLWCFRRRNQWWDLWLVWPQLWSLKEQTWKCPFILRYVLPYTHHYNQLKGLGYKITTHPGLKLFNLIRSFDKEQF